MLRTIKRTIASESRLLGHLAKRIRRVVVEGNEICIHFSSRTRQLVDALQPDTQEMLRSAASLAVGREISVTLAFGGR